MVIAAGYAGPDGVAADAAAMQAFRKADLRVGGGHLYAAVAHYLKAQVAPRLVMNGDRAVFTSAAAVSEMAGWMAHHAGDDQAARQHLARALDLVSVSGDRQVTAHVLASAGHVAHHLREPLEALRASQAGLEVVRSGPCDPDLEAYLLAIEARGFAALREPGEAARCLRLDEKTLQAERGEPCSPWVPRFDEGSLANEAARCMRQLGQLSEARRQAERVIALRPPHHPRSRAFGMLVQAGVLAASRKPGAESLGAVSGSKLGAADRVRLARRAAIDAVAASWTIGSKDDRPSKLRSARRVSLPDLRQPASKAAIPRERAWPPRLSAARPAAAQRCCS